MADYIPTFGDSGNTNADRIEPVIGADPVADAAPSFLGGSGSGDSGGNGGEFDPAIHVGRDKRNGDGSYTRKRGRKSGGDNSSPRRANTRADFAASVDMLTKALAIVHVGIASATRSPEFLLDDSEAKALAEATSNVLVQFDIRPDPKIEACMTLIMTAGTIYTPKIYFARERRKAEKAAND